MSGRISWYQAGFADDTRFKWNTLINLLQKDVINKCTPIVGSGLSEPLFGSYRELAQAWAQRFGFPLAPHNPQGPCSLAASCQIAAAIPNFLIQERGTTSHENLLKTPFKVENGYLPRPQGPGLGIEIDEDKLLAQVGEPQQYPQTYDKDDGSVVDW